MKHTSSERHLLPEQIIRAWDSLLDQATTLAEGEINLVRAGIQYSLPPLSQADALQGLRFYLNDQHVHTTLQAEHLVEQLPVQHEKCRRIATSHPLYTAMIHITGTDNLQRPLQQSCRRLLSRYFAHVSPEAHPETLYNHIVQTRDVLAVLTWQDISGPAEGDEDDHYLMGQVNRYLATLTSVPEDLRRKSSTFQRLFRGMNGITRDDTTSRLPGMSSGPRPPQRRPRKKQQRDDALDNEIEENLRKRAARKQQQISPSSEEYRDQQDEARSAGELGDLIARGPYQSTQASGPSPDGREPDDAVEMIQRTAPSTMTVDDDRSVVQHAQRMSLVDTLSSMTDIHRPTTGQIMEGLFSCRDDPAQWSLGILLLCTGMPLARLQTLTVEASPTCEPDSEEDAPQVVEDGTLLTYRLLDGPSSTPLTDDHRWITLALPKVLIRALQQAVVDHGHRPLKRAAKQLKRTLSRQADHSPGLPPTPARLTASSWMLIRPAALDDVAAKALSGRFGMALSAPAAYRALAPGELNGLFQKVLGVLLPSLTPSPAPRWLTSPPVAWTITPNPRAAIWQTGSAHAVPVAEFRTWFQRLQRGMGQAVRRFMSPLNPRDRSPRDLLEVVAISAAHGYLVLLLATGCRPHGTRVRCERVGDHLWLADKDSPKARESRWIPASKELQASLDAHEALVADATDWLEREGYAVNEHRLTGEFALCAEINWTHRTQMAVTPITHRGFVQQLINLQPTGAEPSLVPGDTVRNITRHSVATYCRGQLSETQLAAMLGHVNGFRQQGPGSSATAPARGAWQTVISDLLKEAGFQELTRSSLQHALRH